MGELKRCCHCKEWLPKSQFWSNRSFPDGLSHLCRDCATEAIHKYQHTPKGKKSRKRYIQSPKGLVAQHRADKKRSSSWKRHAQQVFQAAVRRGEIIRSPVCQQCGIWCATHGHHRDYTRPLDVVWLCRECHDAEHARLRNVA